MAYSDILKLKKVEESEGSKKFVRHLVVGNDAFTVLAYKTLVEKFGSEEVALVTPVEFTLEQLRLKGPSTIRGEKNIEFINAAHKELVEREHEEVPVFFKDLKLKEFGGRSKSEKLLWGEEYFTNKGLELNRDELFPFLNDEYLKELNEKLFKNIITGVVNVDSTDLVDNASFEVSFSNGTIIACESLYWGMSPSEYLDLYSDKNKLSNEFMEFCESSKAPCSLYVRFVFEKPLTDLQSTLFVPLSYTHDWGHFIGDFKENDGKQEIEFLAFVDQNSTTDEEISKKIRILKKNLEKIFPKIKENSFEEFITLTTNTMSSKIDDSIYSKIKDEAQKLTFLSFNAPFELEGEQEVSDADSVTACSHLARALKAQDSLVARLGASS